MKRLFFCLIFVSVSILLFESCCSHVAKASKKSQSSIPKLSVVWNKDNYDSPPLKYYHGESQCKEVIDCVWRDMSDFHEDLAGVKAIDGLYGFIDRTGEIVIPCRWKNVWAFSEGLAIVENFKERFGFINKKGELVIPCQWKKVNPFKNGVAKVSDSRTNQIKNSFLFCIVLIYSYL